LKIYYIIWIQNCAKYWVTRPGLRFGLFWWGSRRLTYWKRFNINRRDKIWVNILVSQLCFLMAFQWDRIRHRLNPISPYFTQANYIIFAISQANLCKLAGAPGGCAPGPLLQISLNSQGRIWTSGNRRQICPAKQVTGLFHATLHFPDVVCLVCCLSSHGHGNWTLFVSESSSTWSYSIVLLPSRCTSLLVFDTATT
jgi:hypothetical protein